MNVILEHSTLEIPCFDELKMGEMNQINMAEIKPINKL